jgi:Family of unknown function (DUF6159)
MFAKLGRGWSMAKGSFSVLRKYPKLAVLPLISGTIFVLVAGLILSSLMPQFGPLHKLIGGVWHKIDPDSSGQVWVYAGGFVVLYLLTAITIFCNVALIDCALRVFAGEEPSVRRGLATAMDRLPQILGWALVATTIGLILNAIEGVLKENLGWFGSLIASLFELSWSTITYFVLPVLATERVGPIAALRRSSSILREKWGESLAGEARFGLLGFLFFLQASALFFVGLAIVMSYGATGLAGLGPLLMTLGVAYGIATLIVIQTLSTVFQAGVYAYASTGQVPAALDPTLVASAFRPK